MRDADSLAVRTDDRPILPWTFVAGALVHLVVPVYLVAIVAICLLRAPAHPDAAALLAIVLPFSLRFVVGYGAVTLIATLAAAIADPLLRRRRARRAATLPSAQAGASARRRTDAIGQARTLLGAAAAGPLDSIEAARWDHRDARYQALSSDLARVVAAAVAAMAEAPADRCTALAATTIATLDRIAVAATALDGERRRLDEGDVETLSRYVRTRYGSSDFAGDADR